MSSKSCPTCGSFFIIRWGYQNNKQRFKCKACGQLFIWRNESKHYERKFIWFRKWVMERHVYKNLVRDSGMSQSSLQRLFKHYLSHVPPLTIRHKQQAHLLIDGLTFLAISV